MSVSDPQGNRTDILCNFPMRSHENVIRFYCGLKRTIWGAKAMTGDVWMYAVSLADDNIPLRIQLGVERCLCGLICGLKEVNAELSGDSV